MKVIDGFTIGGTKNGPSMPGAKLQSMSGDLISRAKLRQSLMIWADKLRTAGECGGCEVELLQAVVKMVDAQAAVDAEPVRHGHWDDSFDGITPYCSVCGMSHNCINRTPDYCPHCGARMDGGTDGDNKQ